MNAQRPLRRSLLPIAAAFSLAIGHAFGGAGPLGPPQVDARILPAAAAFIPASQAPSLHATAAWTAPRRIDLARNCASVAAGIDPAGRYHVAAGCNGRIRYTVARPNGTWATTVFTPPPGRLDSGPMIAFVGSRIYLAFTRTAVANGCGASYTDVGTYYRSRVLPAGAWSAPRRIGSVDDGLSGFRTTGATIKATVVNSRTDRVYYETLAGSTLHRYPITGATGPASLRVGADGRSRVVYRTAGGIRYGVYTGGTLASSHIGGSVAGDYDPVLVLDGADRAHVIWSHSPYADPGCAIPDPTPHDGTYYATNRTGAWTAVRATKRFGASALAVNNATLRVHLLVADDTGLRYSTAPRGGAWTSTLLASGQVSSPTILLRQATGTLFVAYIRSIGTSTSTGIFVRTKG